MRILQILILSMILRLSERERSSFIFDEIQYSTIFSMVPGFISTIHFQADGMDKEVMFKYLPHFQI